MKVLRGLLKASGTVFKVEMIKFSLLRLLSAYVSLNPNHSLDLCYLIYN